MKKKLFGNMPDGKEAFLYKIKSENAEAVLTDKGATLVKFMPYGRDIIGGYDTLEAYVANDSYQGATVGRVANRIENAEFVMDGVKYCLPKNDGNNCLHGGVGFTSYLWEVKEHTDCSITFFRFSGDGEDGFPSGVEVEVTYTLIDTSLWISYLAEPSGKTPIALTNHTYFNLNGLGGTILNHTARIYADRYTEVNENLIPSGIRPSVKDTVFDFTTPRRIGERVGDDFIGYDHNFILCPTVFKEFAGISLGLAAEIENSDMRLSVYTDQPGVQFYIGNFLGNGYDFKGGVKQVRHGAFCLETQTEPNCINHGEGFFDKGDVYSHNTVYTVEKISR